MRETETTAVLNPAVRNTAIREGRCTEHRDRPATCVAFGAAWHLGSVGASLMGSGGAAWEVCGECAGDYHGSARLPRSVRS